MQSFLQFLIESSLDDYSKEIDRHYQKSKENPKNHEVHDENGNHVASFELAHRAGNIRLKNIQSHVPNAGHASKLMKHLTKLADRHKVKMELTASPHGDEKNRLDHNQLHKFYTKHGFEMEHGYDPSLGYMIRHSK